MYDVVVIGAGVIGTAVARELMKFDIKVMVLERENDVACGTTKANSAIVHAGYDAPYGTLKGKFNAWGNRIFGEVCETLNVPFKRIGSLVCAFSEEDLATLEALKHNGELLGISNLEIVDQLSLRAMEPNVSDDAVAALYAPTAGITEPWELAIAYMENAMDNGAELKLNFEVKTIEKKCDHYIISDGNTLVEAKYVVNAAGVYADQIYHMVCDVPEFTITPRRGQYFLLDKSAKDHVRRIIFPCPSNKGKGTLVLPTVNGNILIGPDSEDLEISQKEATETTLERLNLVKQLANHLIKDIPFSENITTFSGLRAEPSTDDFIIGFSQVDGFYNIAGMKSPGLSSAPAIGIYVADEISGVLNAARRTRFEPKRSIRIQFEHLNDLQKKALIERNPAYGRVICRCEMITEGEILDAIHRNCGGTTLNGIKRRVRPGAGRCQGGFCGPRVVEILARELGCAMESVCQEGQSSYILVGKTKSL
ncbi:NAD(P)/FAD-dependent oxidoreductase [Fusibacter ferrireducens]|uniref:NAD(P)/FAD-dependent oxidoreductase n=1 Tax=Fusibacter ferrireducens TaxID=2785058 RepID=A0ABR9ZMX9_9FIRM|nr:NAD(P)/FAD-dependent oxidoreductase [Fusibacter ferrireducens]MBF4691817.1 NAD(P)/FAD-dependent oxidoreductase [Fusibacter ferrireducens]